MQQKLDRRYQLESNENCVSSYTSTGLQGFSQRSRDNIVSEDALGNIISGTSLWRPNYLMATEACELQQANGGHNRREKLRGNTESFRLPKSDGNSSLQNENVGTIVFPTMGEHPSPATPVGPIGHSIAWMPHPHSEPNLLGSVQAPGQPSVHQDFQGLHNARMVLPIELAEEPVYVNAKQYHGILRRRQLRAKAELENKVPKVRKPYLHESRHLHAMRRARGCGGRFLSTKKFEGEGSKATSEIGTSSGANDSGTRSSQDSELAFPVSSGNVDFAANYGELGNRSLQGRRNSDLRQWGSYYQWRSQ